MTPDNGRYLTVEEVRNRLDHMRGVLHGESGGGDGERAGSETIREGRDG